jgi:hypothetical protein
MQSEATAAASRGDPSEQPIGPDPNSRSSRSEQPLEYSPAERTLMSPADDGMMASHRAQPRTKLTRDVQLTGTHPIAGNLVL